MGGHRAEENGGEVASGEEPLSALKQLPAGRQDGVLPGEEAEEGQHDGPVQRVHAGVHRQALACAALGAFLAEPRGHYQWHFLLTFFLLVQLLFSKRGLS